MFGKHGFSDLVPWFWGSLAAMIVAFAILLMNLCVPLIDQFTQPRVYGEVKKSKAPPA